MRSGSPPGRTTTRTILDTATYLPGLFGFTGCGAALPDGLWSYHQRVRQYHGGHNETYAGVTINIDTNAVDGPTAG